MESELRGGGPNLACDLLPEAEGLVNQILQEYYEEQKENGNFNEIVEDSKDIVEDIFSDD